MASMVLPEPGAPGPHPLPPADLAGRAVPLLETAGPFYRIHLLEYSPLFFGRTGRYRFDAPGGEFGVLYAGRDAHCAFIETLGHNTGLRLVASVDLRARGLARIESAWLLRLVDLTGAGLARLGADERLCAGGYAIAQQWALALAQHPEQPDGLCYRSRHDPTRLCVAIFEQAGVALSAHSVGSLASPDLADLLVDLLDTYGFGLAG
jgi:hypothetical protein